MVFGAFYNTEVHGLQRVTNNRVSTERTSDTSYFTCAEARPKRDEWAISNTRQTFYSNRL